MCMRENAHSVPALTIIIPVYNAERTLADCLNAIGRSSCRDFEVIVVDDCSSDSSREIARTFPCTVVSLKKNMGAAIARNIGASQAKSGLFFFVDQDILIQPSTIAQILEILRSDSGVKAMGGIISKRSLKRRFGRDLRALQYYYFVYRWQPQEVRRCTSCFPSECGVIYKDVFREAGGFNETYKTGIEDYEFGKRIRARHAIWLYRQIEVYHYTKGIGERCRKLFERSFPYVKYMLACRTFETNDPAINRKEIISTCSVFLAAVTFALSFFDIRFLTASALGWAVFLAVNLDFFIFLYKEKGLLFLGRSACSLPAMYLSVSSGIISAVFFYAGKRLAQLMTLKRFAFRAG